MGGAVPNGLPKTGQRRTNERIEQTQLTLKLGREIKRLQVKFSEFDYATIKGWHPRGYVLYEVEALTRPPLNLPLDMREVRQMARDATSDKEGGGRSSVIAYTPFLKALQHARAVPSKAH